MTIEKEITVSELRELYKSNKYNIEIDTPDGFQSIGAWFDKGLLDIIQITCENGLITKCADSHLIETLIDPSSNQYVWKLASELTIGESILTNLGVSKISDVTYLEPDMCYDFEISHPNHRYWGDGISSHNSGKSLIASQIMKHAQAQNVFIVGIDSEAALDEEWLIKAGVDVSPDRFLRVQMATVDDVAGFISEFMKDYKEQWKNVDEDQRIKVLFVVDSLGMLLSKTDIDQFEKGEIKGDMGRKAKALKSLISNCVVMFNDWGVGMVATNHTYVSQDMWASEPDIIAGGSGPLYAASIIVTMKKLKLKEDEDGNKVSEVRGIRSMAKVIKTRFNKPFESVEIKIPYDQGIDRYSGLIDLFEQRNLLTKDGNKLKYIDVEGTEYKFFRKQFTHEFLEKIITEWPDKTSKIPETSIEQEDTSNEQ